MADLGQRTQSETGTGADLSLHDTPTARPPSGGGPEPGECLADRFVIRRELGRGGGGAVFVAHDRTLARDVAIKVLPHGPADETALARFEQEARAAAALEHENILAVHDVGVHGGAPFIVSELLEGSNLRQRLADGPIPLPEVLNLASQLAVGLAATHEKGIVHRDLKPENLFIVKGGRLKILDFGVAKLLRPDPDPQAPRPHTKTGAAVGTVPYMSPEQVRGTAADARSDVFAFGVILHEMLTGRAPFAREQEVETGYAILNDDPPPLPRDCPQAVCRLVERCLEKDPADRPQSTRELVEVLEPLARLPSRALRRPWTTRPWALVVSALLGAAVIVAGDFKGALRRLLLSTPLGRIFSVSTPEVKRLAILPFHVVGTAGDEAFTAGLNEILTGRLQQVEQLQKSLRVVSTSDVQKERVRDAEDARKAFGANLALSGTAQWEGQRVTIAVSLIDTGTRLILSAREVPGSREDASALSADLLQKVSEMLKLQLEPGDPLLPPSSAQALYVQGRGYLRRYDLVDNVDRAVEIFDRALEQDPRYALVHAGRAEAWLRRYRTTHEVTALEQARASSKRGLELGPGLAQVHFTAGLVHSAAGEGSAAVDQFQQALKIEPANADTLRELANAYDKVGRTAEAEATLRRAVELRSDSWAACKDLGVFYNRHGRMQEALPWFQRVVALTPDNYASYSNLGAVYLRLGRYAEAAAALKKSIALHPTAVAYINLGNVHYFGEGRFKEASESYRKATELTPTDERAWGALADALRWVPGTSDETAGAYAQAIALAEKQAALQPRDAELRSRLAMYRAYSGDAAGADADLREALRLDSSDGTILFRAALVREQLGRRKQALEAIEEALRAGISPEEIEKAPALEDLRRDPDYRRISSSLAELPR
jgi:serine/threonine protein kinase/tetratricopeptide (TPR) repeat protein